MPATGAPLVAAPLTNGHGGPAAGGPRRPPSVERRGAAPAPAPAAPAAAEQRRAFARLQPVCAPLLALRSEPGALAAGLQRLAAALPGVGRAGLAACADYVLFPLLFVVDSAALLRAPAPPGVPRTPAGAARSRYQASPSLCLSRLAQLAARRPPRHSGHRALLVPICTFACGLARGASSPAAGRVGGRCWAVLCCSCGRGMGTCLRKQVPPAGTCCLTDHAFFNMLGCLARATAPSGLHAALLAVHARMPDISCMSMEQKAVGGPAGRTRTLSGQHPPDSQARVAIMLALAVAGAQPQAPSCAATKPTWLSLPCTRCCGRRRRRQARGAGAGGGQRPRGRGRAGLPTGAAARRLRRRALGRAGGLWREGRRGRWACRGRC